jgi:hypothetical protein
MWSFCQPLQIKGKPVSESFFGMFEVFCNFGILTAFVKSKSDSDRTQYHGIGLSSAHLKGVKGMKVEKFNLFVVITTLVVLASIVFTALSGTQTRNVEPASYKYPCIVLKVDNQGCQTEIEMRSRMAARQNGYFTD